MTVVGSVEYLVEGVIDPAHFDKSIDTPLNRAAARAGDRFGAVLGKAIGLAARPFVRRAGDDIGEELSRQGRAHGLTFGKLVGAGVTAGLGVQSIGAGVNLLTRGISGAVGAADELDTAIGRSGRTFGAATAEVQAFASDTRRNLLQSKQDALTASDAFGLLFRGGGVDQAKAAELSVRLTGIAQNLSALHHVPIGDVLNALREGVQGNVEPLRDLGINLDAARVKSEAYADGLARPVRDAGKIARAQTVVAAAAANLGKVETEHGKGTLAAAEAQDRLSKAQEALAKASAGASGPLSANQSLLARTSLILRDTQGTTGAAATATDDYTVATEHLRAQLGNVSAELGTKLLPYIVDGERKFSTLVDQFRAGTGTGGEIRDTLGAITDVARDLGGVLNATVVPAVRFFADHPDALKGIAEGMAAYATATRAAAVWSALIKAPPVTPGVPGGGAGGKVVNSLGIGAAIGVAAGALDPHLGPLSSKSYAGSKPLGNVNDIARGPNGEFLRHPDGTFVMKSELSAPAPKRPTVVDDSVPGRSRDSQRQVGAAAADAKKQADALHATQVRMRDAATKAANATKYEADQLAAYQERQREAVQSAEDAARARGEATTAALQGQLDKIRQQTDAVSAFADKIRDFRRDVVDQAGRFTALTSLVSDPSRATASGILGSLQSRVLAETLFQKNLTTLASRHLDKGVLGELAQAGPEQRALASALAQGTPAQIAALNAAERASRARASSLGTLATDQQFGAGTVQRTNSELARLNAQVTALNKLIAAQPALIGKAVDQAGRNVKVAQKTGTRTAVAR